MHLRTDVRTVCSTRYVNLISRRPHDHHSIRAYGTTLAFVLALYILGQKQILGYLDLGFSSRV